MKVPETALWKEGAKKEMGSLDDLGVCTLVPTQTFLKDIIDRSKLIFKVKSDNMVRIAAQGWNQMPGIDCGGNYAAVCRLQTIPMVLTIVAEFYLEIR